MILVFQSGDTDDLRPASTFEPRARQEVHVQFFDDQVHPEDKLKWENVPYSENNLSDYLCRIIHHHLTLQPINPPASVCIGQISQGVMIATEREIGEGSEHSGKTSQESKSGGSKSSGNESSVRRIKWTPYLPMTGFVVEASDPTLPSALAGCLQIAQSGENISRFEDEWKGQLASARTDGFSWIGRLARRTRFWSDRSSKK